MDTILKEARKFGVYLVLANQNVSDIQPTTLLSGLLNNTDVKLVGRNGNKSLSVLSKEIGLPVKALDTLKQYEFILKSSDKKAVKIKTKAILKKPYFQMNRKTYTHFKNNILKQYYKEVQNVQTPIPQVLN